MSNVLVAFMLTLISALIGASSAYFASRRLQKTLLFQQNKNALINQMLSIIRTQEENYVNHWENLEPTPKIFPMTELQKLLSFGRRRYSIKTQDIEKEPHKTKLQKLLSFCRCRHNIKRPAIEKDLREFIKYTTGGKFNDKQRIKNRVRINNIHATALELRIKLLENKI